jgi:hypothetical protein
MFAVAASQIAANPAFPLKLILIAATRINAAVFHADTFRSVKHCNRGVATPMEVKAIAILSLVLWTAVIIGGYPIA